MPPGNFGVSYSIIKYQVSMILCFEYCERTGQRSLQIKYSINKRNMLFVKIALIGLRTYHKCIV